MSSHREAPAISKDPVADNTDTYAFVTPGNTVTIIANYLPVEAPAGGPNFYEFDDDVAYAIHIDNNGDGQPDVTYQFRFTTTITNPNTFLYNTGPIDRLDSPNWNRRQTYAVDQDAAAGDAARPDRGQGPALPAVQHRATVDAQLRVAGRVRSRNAARRRRRCSPGSGPTRFFVDLGSVFDLATLRPFESLHLIPTANAPGVDSLKSSNVHTLAIQVPISELTRDGSVPTDPMSATSVFGIWAAADAPEGACARHENRTHTAGPWVQVSRLGNPLFNEVIVPMADKDEWNARDPSRDKEFAKYVAQPGAGKAASGPVPRRVPEPRRPHGGPSGPARHPAHGDPRRDHPGVPELHGTDAGGHAATQRRDPTERRRRTASGILGGDLAGFPNGRRLTDDVVTDRAAGRGRRHVPAHRSELHARRCRRRSSKTGRSTIPDECS